MYLNFFKFYANSHSVTHNFISRHVLHLRGPRPMGEHAQRMLLPFQPQWQDLHQLHHRWKNPALVRHCCQEESSECVVTFSHLFDPMSTRSYHIICKLCKLILVRPSSPSGEQQRRAWLGGMGLLWQLPTGGKKPSLRERGSHCLGPSMEGGQG